MKPKSVNQRKFKHYSYTVFKQLCREMSDVFIAPKLWLPNMPDFNAANTIQNLSSAMTQGLSAAYSRCRLLMSWGDAWQCVGVEAEGMSYDKKKTV